MHALSRALAHVALYSLVAVTVFAAATAWAQPLPPAWRATGSAPQKYSMTAAPDAAFAGQLGGSIRSIVPVDAKASEFGALGQAASALPYRGQRLAMRAWIKTEQAESAQMWLRVDAADRVLLLENMDRRPIVGTVGWQSYEIVVDVPEDAAYLVYGALLVGNGRMDIDAITIGPVPVSVDTTRKIYKEGQVKPRPADAYRPPSVVWPSPVNLDFEQTGP